MTESVFLWSKTAANNATADGAINWAEGQAPSTVNGSARSMMAALAKFLSDIGGAVTSTGSTNEYTITTNQGVPSHAVPVIIAFKADKTSSGAATTTIDGLAQKSIFRCDGTATQSGDIVSGGIYLLAYQSTLGGYVGLNIGPTVGAYKPGGTDVALADGGTGASLVDPNADRIMFWDDSAGAVTWLAPNTGLAISGTNLNLSFLGFEALADPNADRIAFWDDSAGAFDWLVPNTGLTVSGTNLNVSASVVEDWSAFIATPSNKSYKIVVNSSFAATINEVTTVCVSGTCTVTGKINTTALGGTANSASSSETTQTHVSSNSVAVGDDIVLTISSNSSCADLTVKIKYTRTVP